MKKLFITLSVFAFTITACGQGKKKEPTPTLLTYYTVTWENDDGSVLEVDESVLEGSVPSYEGATPVKSSNDDYEYVFAGWTPELKVVLSDQTYVATYDQVHKVYTYTFDLNGGTSPSFEETKLTTGFNKNLFILDVQREGYRFRGWTYDNTPIVDEKGNVLVDNFSLSQDATFVALYSPIDSPVIDIDNKMVYYGHYPQTVVDDEDTINALNSLGELSVEPLTGWYLLKDTYYAKLNATPWPSHSFFDNGEQVVKGEDYWFKCEPII